MRSMSIAALLLGSACGRGDIGGGDGSLGLDLVDVIRLSEADSSFIAEAGLSFEVSESGDIYIVDEFQPRILRYASDGGLVQVYSKRGSGPGEFQSFQRLTLVRDGILLQASGGRIRAFDVASGGYIGEAVHNRGFLHGYSGIADTLFIPLIYYFGHQLGVVRITWPELMAKIEAGDDQPLVPTMVGYPAEYLASSNLRSFTDVNAVAWRDTLLAGYSGVPYLVRYTTEGVPIDTFEIPVRHRRGFPSGWLEPFLKPGELPLKELVEAFSYLNGIWRMSDGRFIVWYQENRVNPDGPNPPLFGKAWISLLTADLSEACVDASIDFPGTEWPNLTVWRDTIFAFDQTIAADSTTAVSEIARYVVDTSECRWMPIELR